MISKALSWALGIAATGFAARKLYTLNDLSQNLIIDTAPRIHQVKILPPMLILAVDPTIKNPTRGTLKIKQPTVSLYASEADLKANNPFASSTPENTDFVIPKSGTVKLNPIMLPISGTALVSLISTYLKTQKLSIWVRKGTIIGNAAPFWKDELQTFK